MKDRPKYILRDFSLTDEYIRKYLACYGYPEELTHFILNDINDEVKKMLDQIYQKLRSDILPILNKTPDSHKNINNGELSFPNGLLPEKLFVSYIFDQLNTLLAYMIGEIPNQELFVKDLEDTETTFYMKCNIEIRENLSSKTKSHPNPVDELLRHSDMLHSINDSRSLTSKLIENGKNSFVGYLENQIQFLKDKIDYGGIKYAEPAIVNKISTSEKASNYLIPEIKIDQLYNLFVGTVIESMAIVDFRLCFDSNHTPDQKPNYKKGKKNLMIYALSMIDDIDEKIALTNFDVSHYHQMKNRKLPKSKRESQTQIKNILKNNPINVSSK